MIMVINDKHIYFLHTSSNFRKFFQKRRGFKTRFITCIIETNPQVQFVCAPCIYMANISQHENKNMWQTCYDSSPHVYFTFNYSIIGILDISHITHINYHHPTYLGECWTNFLKMFRFPLRSLKNMVGMIMTYIDKMNTHP